MAGNRAVDRFIIRLVRYLADTGVTSPARNLGMHGLRVNFFAYIEASFSPLFGIQAHLLVFVAPEAIFLIDSPFDGPPFDGPGMRKEGQE